jgi:hypothetical protein
VKKYTLSTILLAGAAVFALSLAPVAAFAFTLPASGASGGASASSSGGGSAILNGTVVSISGGLGVNVSAAGKDLGGTGINSGVGSLAVAAQYSHIQGNAGAASGGSKSSASAGGHAWSTP